MSQEQMRQELLSYCEPIALDTKLQRKRKEKMKEVVTELEGPAIVAMYDYIFKEQTALS